MACQWAPGNPCEIGCGLEDVRPDWCTFDSKVCGWCNHYNGAPEECTHKMLTHPGKLEPIEGASFMRRCIYQDDKCIA